MKNSNHPKVFISYCWTSEEYKERVLQLATMLMRNGVDVILDRWELHAGYDLDAFMEMSIEEADKVLILCDESYTKKANRREGGVGTETTIITPELHSKYKQKKFIPVIMESSWSVPSYIKSRLSVSYVKGSEEEFKELLREIYEKPKNRKPELGETPAWLDENEDQTKRIQDLGRSDDDSVKNKPEDISDFVEKPTLGESPKWTQEKDPKASKRISQNTPKTILTVGDKYTFGRYPYRADGKVEPLKWRVLEIKDNKALLITEELIDNRRYHNKYEPVSWKDCTLRTWLNSVFVQTAFNEEERSRIAEKTIPNTGKRVFGTEGCRETKDKMFTLSIEEAERYFKNDVDRRAHVTPYAEKPHDGLPGSYKNKNYKTEDGRAGTGWWWLRSPGYVSRDAVYVNTDGGVAANGNLVYFYGSVRPAFWLNL